MLLIHIDVLLCFNYVLGNWLGEFWVDIIIIISISIQPLGLSGQEPEPSHVTSMALVHCILDKFLGVVCLCFPPHLDCVDIMHYNFSLFKIMGSRLLVNVFTQIIQFSGTDYWH